MNTPDSYQLAEAEKLSGVFLCAVFVVEKSVFGVFLLSF